MERPIKSVKSVISLLNGETLKLQILIINHITRSEVVTKLVELNGDIHLGSRTCIYCSD